MQFSSLGTNNHTFLHPCHAHTPTEVSTRPQATRASSVYWGEYLETLSRRRGVREGDQSYLWSGGGVARVACRQRCLVACADAADGVTRAHNVFYSSYSTSAKERLDSAAAKDVGTAAASRPMPWAGAHWSVTKCATAVLNHMLGKVPGGDRPSR